MSKSNLLFVDDEPHITEALKRALRREPYEIHCAGSAAEGLEILSKESIDIVISDEQMPIMSGCQFLSEVRRRHPSVIRMILTGQASMDAAISAINDGGVYRFFTKPCNPEDLKVTIRQAMLQKQLVMQSRKLLRKYREQSSYLEELERTNPELLNVECDADGAIIISDVDDDMDDLLSEIHGLFGSA